MKRLAELTAKRLIDLKVFKVQLNNLFTWANGWKSPIYCDDKKILSHPRERDFYKLEIARIILEQFPGTDVVAAVATNAIAMGALVSHQLSLPFVYVYPHPKDHGLENQIEGDVRPRQKVVVIEDLISLGVHALATVEALRQNGCEVLGVISIVDMNLPGVHETFLEKDVPLVSLTTVRDIAETALAEGLLTQAELEQLRQWHQNPKKWKSTKAK